jgi:hypothetical protein
VFLINKRISFTKRRSKYGMMRDLKMSEAWEGGAPEVKIGGMILKTERKVAKPLIEGLLEHLRNKVLGGFQVRNRTKESQ